MTATRTAGRRRLAASLLLAAAFPLAACADDSAGPEAGADVQDVANNQIGIDPFLGNEVTVSGKVTSILNPMAFRIGGDDWGGEPLKLVDAANANVAEGQVVQITGVVREFEETAIEQEYDFLLDSALFNDWAGDHVVVAKQVQPL